MNKSELKEALIEILEDNPEIIGRAFANAFEDIGLANAIKDGDKKNFIEFDKFMEYLNERVDKNNEDKH